MTHLRKQLILFFSLFLFTFFATAQNEDFEIKGQVFLHNSMDKNGKIKYVRDAEIITLNAKPKTTSSDKRGQFKLKFKDVDTTVPVFINVKKSGYEVVDASDLQYFFQDKKTRLRVFLAEQGYLKKARAELIEASLKAHNTEKERLLDLLEFGGIAEKAAFKTIEERTGRKLYTSHDAQEYILQLSKDYLEHLSHYSYEVAIVNPDFASDTYLLALDYFQQGDPEETVATLQEEDLDGAFKEIVGMIKEVKDDPKKVREVIDARFRRIDQIRNNYIFQVIALQQFFRFKEAENMIVKLEQLNNIIPTHKCNRLIEDMRAFNYFETIKPNENILLEKKLATTPEKKELNEEEEIVENIVLESYSKPIAIEPNVEEKPQKSNSVAELWKLENNPSVAKVETTKNEITNSPNVFSDKGNQQNAEEILTSVAQIETVEEKKDLVKKDLSSQSLANASIDDFENILFFSNISSVELISILQDEKKEIAAEEKKSTVVPEVIKRDKLVKRPAPPAVVYVETTPQSVVVDKSDWLVFSDIPEPQFYSITKKTSLRKSANPKSKILKRLDVGTEMEFIEKIDKYWYKMRLNGKIGYVKSYRLKKVN